MLVKNIHFVLLRTFIFSFYSIFSMQNAKVLLF